MQEGEGLEIGARPRANRLSRRFACAEFALGSQAFVVANILSNDANQLAIAQVNMNGGATAEPKVRITSQESRITCISLVLVGRIVVSASLLCHLDDELMRFLSFGSGSPCDAR